MGITRNEACHQESMKEVILAQNDVNLFDRSELDAKLFWSEFDSAMRHIQSLASYIDYAHLPLGLTKIYVDLISHHVKIIKDMIFVSYGLLLDVDPHNIVARNYTNSMAIGLWAMDHQKEIESICNISGGWINNFLRIDNISEQNIEKKFREVQKQHSAYYNISYDLQRAYIYAPYQEKNISLSEQLNELDESMRTIFSVISMVMKTPIVLLKDFDVFVNKFRESKSGQKLISGWRSDYTLPREQFILRLKEKKSLSMWVDKCRLLHEGKIERNELFYDSTISSLQHFSEKNKTSNWLSIFTITAILREYDEQQQNLGVKGTKVEIGKKGEIPQKLLNDGTWEKLKAAGILDDNDMPRLSRSEAAILAEILLEKIKKRHNWTIFECIWDKKNIRNDFQRAVNMRKYNDVREKFIKIID